MAASYPSSIKTFTAKANGDYILHTHVTEIEEEVVALETALKTGPTALASATFSGTVGVTGAVTLTGGLNTPLVVAQGGTGLATLASAGVLVGAGTGTPTTVAPSTSGNVLTSDGSVWASTAVAASVTDLGISEGRLTLTSGSPVTTADVTGATNIYFAPYAGNRIALYDGSSAWNVRTFTQITIALGTLTDAKPYDLFAYDNSGTVTFDSPVVWTNDTTRATALTTQDGVLVKTGATTRRYIGTFYTTATTTTEDSLLHRYLWNYYNRVLRVLRAVDTASSWTYTGFTIRQANAKTTNKVSVMVGVAEVAMTLKLLSLSMAASANVNRRSGIGEDTTTGFIDTTAVQTHASQMFTFDGGWPDYNAVILDKYPPVGKHFYSWNEKCDAGTVTFYSGLGESDSGLTGMIEG